jgi:hypothetical protein
MKLKVVLISSVLALSNLVSAKEVAGIDLEEVARLSVANTELVLNGAAVRKEAQHAVYVGGLYLKEQTSSFEEIMADPNPKRFLFYCSTNKISANKLVRAWQQGFTINYSAEELNELKPLIEEFNKVWANGLKEGDEVWVDYIPAVGTRISLNGEIVSEINSRDFYKAFLKTWLGPHPFNARVKNMLLGK